MDLAKILEPIAPYLGLWGPGFVLILAAIIYGKGLIGAVGDFLNQRQKAKFQHLEKMTKLRNQRKDHAATAIDITPKRQKQIGTSRPPRLGQGSIEDGKTDE